MLDPQAQALIDLIAERGLPPTHTLAPPEARAFYRDRRSFSQPAPRAMAEVQDLVAPGPLGDIPLRLYRPAGVASPAPTLVYFHGGGWVIGDLDTHDVLCRQLADEAGCVVVSVDYRMGPEHRFPAAPDDCLAATRWLQAQAGALGLDARRFAVGGDSAGGNLAAVVCLAWRDAAEPLPLRFQLLIYPATDMRATAPSHTSNGQGYVLTSDTIAYFRRHYLDSSDQHRLARLTAAARPAGRSAASAGADRRLRPACATRAGSTPMPCRRLAAPPSTSASSGRSMASSPWAG